MRYLAMFLVLAALACGQDSGAPKVSSGTQSGSEGAAGGSKYSATAQRCLDLVEEGRLSDAIDPCTQAVRESPQSQELAAALDKAKSGLETTAKDAGKAMEGAKADAEAWKKTGEAYKQ